MTHTCSPYGLYAWIQTSQSTFSTHPGHQRLLRAIFQCFSSDFIIKHHIESFTHIVWCRYIRKWNTKSHKSKSQEQYTHVNLPSICTCYLSVKSFPLLWLFISLEYIWTNYFNNLVTCFDGLQTTKAGYHKPQ